MNNGHEKETSQKLQNLSRRGFNNNGIRNQNYNTSLTSSTIRRGELGSQKEQKLVNPLNHQRPNLGVQARSNQDNFTNIKDNFNTKISKSNDVGSKNLQKSLTNKARNILKKRNRNNSIGLSNSSDMSNLENNYNNDLDNNISINEKVQAIRKKVMIIKMSIIGLALFAFIFIVLLVAQIVTGGTALPTMPLSSASTYGTEKFASLTQQDSKHHNDEINYYKKLKGITSAYNGQVNVNYINALLMQLYYETDYEIKGNEFEDTLGFNFADMTVKADAFVDIINDINSTDYAVDGEIFKVLKNNNTIRDYYKDVLKTTTLDDVLKRAFAMADELDAVDITDDTVVTSETNVSVQETKVENGKTQTTTKTVSMNSYLADSIYAKATSLASESVKAYTIAYSTNVVAQNKNLTIDTNTASANNNLCSVTLGCSYDEKGNLVSGGGSQSSQNTNFYNGKYYYKTPLTETEISALNDNINSVYGNVLVNSDGTYPTLDVNKINGLGEGDYKSILNSGYGSLSIKNIGENSYVLDGSYGTKKVQTNVIFYDQNNYPNDSFCGLKKETIETSGCGVTSMAMVVSTYQNNKQYDPIYMNQEATNKKMCGAGSGTYQAFFCKEANAMGYKCLSGSKYNKSLLNNVLKHLSAGHLVIARMGPSHFTGAGHYIVLGGVDPDTKKVYVYDPNHRDNFKWRKTGNGWYSFNDIIVKEAYNFYIIWKG